MHIENEPGVLGYFDITFGKVWDYIQITRGYLENVLKINLVEKKDIARIVIAASELIENSIKYSNKDGVRVKVIRNPKTNNIELVVYNHTTKKEADIVMDNLQQMGKTDPLMHYITLMKLTVTNKDKKSGLGLARINHESQAKLHAEYLEKDGIISVKALFKL